MRPSAKQVRALRRRVRGGRPIGWTVVTAGRLCSSVKGIVSRRSVEEGKARR